LTVFFIITQERKKVVGMLVYERRIAKIVCRIRTVNCDSDSLVEGETILADEGWDLAKLVDLEVFLWNTLRWLSLDDLELNAVGLCNCADSS
jgi:hypothetical protein